MGTATVRNLLASKQGLEAKPAWALSFRPPLPLWLHGHGVSATMRYVNLYFTLHYITWKDKTRSDIKANSLCFSSKFSDE